MFLGCTQMYIVFLVQHLGAPRICDQRDSGCWDIRLGPPRPSGAVAMGWGVLYQGWSLLNPQASAKILLTHMIQLPSNMRVPWKCSIPAVVSQALLFLLRVTLRELLQHQGFGCLWGLASPRRALSLTALLCLVTHPAGPFMATVHLSRSFGACEWSWPPGGLPTSRGTQTGAQGLQGEAQRDYASRRGYHPPSL